MAHSEPVPHARLSDTPVTGEARRGTHRPAGRRAAGQAEAYFAALMQGSLFDPGAGPRAAVPTNLPAPTDRPTAAGPWTLGRAVGRGGTAVVYAAHLALPGDGGETRAVVKLARTGLSPDALACFGTEARLLPLVASRGVVRLCGAGHLPDGRPYLALERVPGVPVTRYARGMPVHGRLAAFRDVCTAVATVHRCGVVHCDLKPSNVLVSKSGHVTLLDFGIAQRLSGETGPGRAPLMTLDYAAPEQYLGAPVSPATDVYSLGLVLHDLLCGRRRRVPWGLSGGGETVFSGTLTCALATGPDGPNRFEPVDVEAMWFNLKSTRLDWRVEGVIRTALETDPGRRYASAAELGFAVEHVLGAVPAGIVTATHSPT